VAEVVRVLAANLLEYPDMLLDLLADAADGVLALTKQQVDTPTQDSAAQSVLTVEIPKGSLPAQP
jgi:hypothetical protein